MGEYVATEQEASLLSLPGGGEQYINTDLPTIQEETERGDTPSAGVMPLSGSLSDLSFSVFAIDENTAAFVAGKSGLVWSDFKVGYDGYYYQDSSIIDAEKHFNTLKDDMMCWAATTANMLYYTNWGFQSASDEESIFSIFVDNFQFGDKYGGNAYYGLKWFFTGDYLPAGWDEWDYPFEETGGFYEKAFDTAVFSDYVTNATADHSGFTLAEEKLKDGYAVGLSVSFYDANGNYENGHAVTLWGFTYDTTLSVTDPNYYTGIIITDSDDDKNNYTDQVFPDTLKVLSMTYDSAKGHYVLAPEYHVSGSTIVNDFTFLAPNPGFAEDAAVTSTGAVKIYSSGRLVSQTSPVVSMELSASNCSAMYISSGGTAAQTTINNGGDVYISSGGTANNTVVNSFGSMVLYAGGSANSTYVGSGGHLWLISATSPGAIEVARGGTLLLAGPCVATGDIILKGYLDRTFLVQGTLDMAGYTLNLDITERNSNSAAIVDNFSLISNADIVVTVSASQSSGDYCLIGSAANSVSITIQCGSEMQELGVGESFKYGSIQYTLTHSDGDLFLSVTNPATVPPVAVDEYIPGTWSTDWQQASEYAAKTGKKIFAFYGDVFYCPYSYNMENYLLKAEDFLEFAKENLVLLYNTPVPGKSYYGNPAGYILSADGSILAYRSGFGIDYHDVWMAWLKLQTGNPAGIYEERRSSIDHIGSTFSGTVDDALYIANSGIANQAIINSGTRINILSGGTANDTTVNSSGYLCVYSGGTANDTTMGMGDLYVYSGGTANDTTMNYGGYLWVGSGGTANSTTVNIYGLFDVESGGTANDTTLNDGVLSVSSGGTANSTTMIEYSDLIVYSGGTANDTTVNSRGELYVSSGGTANDTTMSGGRLYVSGGTANDTMVNSGGWLYVSSGGTATATTLNDGVLSVSSGGTANSTTVNKYGWLRVTSGGTANDTTVNDWGELDVYSGGTHRGGLQIKSGAVVSAYTGATIDFSVAERTAEDGYLINDISLIKGAPTYTITVAANQRAGTYKLAQGASSFTGTLTIGDGTVDFGSVTVNGKDLIYNSATYSLDQSDGNLTLTITAAAVVPILPGSTICVSWKNVSGSSFVVEYSHNDFADTLRVETENNALDTFNMPAGTYQWRVKTEEREFVNGEGIVSDNASAPQKFVSEADGNMDLFFGNANGVWKAQYAAQHLGNAVWNGTREQVLLEGKNRIADIFEGSRDANILVLTDGANGDALFVDDIYTALGGQARIAQIDEIRAGAGDDIVDMTSQRYAYTGDGVKIYGGLGNDTIWANKGNNTLFGDAGNDRLVGAAGNDVIAGGTGNDSMHGGGGSDIFTFGGAWGNDTIEQLADGSVTLWFETGSESNWNAESLTYSDGVNSVSVSGCVNVTLRFGSVPSLPAGAFEEETTEKVFEEKGMLA